MTRGASGRRKKTVSKVEAVSCSTRRQSGRGPDRHALILTFAQLERDRQRSPRTEWAVDEKVIEQL